MHKIFDTLFYSAATLSWSLPFLFFLSLFFIYFLFPCWLFVLPFDQSLFIVAVILFIMLTSLLKQIDFFILFFYITFFLWTFSTFFFSLSGEFYIFLSVFTLFLFLFFFLLFYQVTTLINLFFSSTIPYLPFYPFFQVFFYRFISPFHHAVCFLSHSFIR